MYVYTYKSVYIYIHMYICKYTYIFMYIYKYMRIVFIHVGIYRFASICFCI